MPVANLDKISKVSAYLWSVVIILPYIIQFIKVREN